MSSSRLDHLATIRAGARSITVCELMKKRRERGEGRQSHALPDILSAQPAKLECFHTLDTSVLSDRRYHQSQTVGCKGKGKKINVERDRSIERAKERERDHPTGRNGRQKQKEVEWEDERTGHRCLIPLQGFKGVRRVRRMGSLITREKGDIRTQTQKTRRNMHGHACTGPDIFSQLHCSPRLAHLHIRGSRTHYQLGEMKGARGGRRTGEEGGDQEEKGRRLMLRRAA